MHGYGKLFNEFDYATVDFWGKYVTFKEKKRKMESRTQKKSCCFTCSRENHKIAVVTMYLPAGGKLQALQSVFSF